MRERDDKAEGSAHEPHIPALRLVPPRAEHAPLWHRWRAEPVTQQFNPLSILTTKALAERLARHCGSDFGDRTRVEYRWMVALGDELIGTVSVMNVSWGMGYAEIGYMLTETHHGRGWGTRAVTLLVEKVFAETDMQRVYALVSTENVASCRLLERLGFAREGLLREHYVIQGRRVDEIIYGLLRHEWEARPSHPSLINPATGGRQ